MVCGCVLEVCQGCLGVLKDVHIFRGVSDSFEGFQWRLQWFKRNSGSFNGVTESFRRVTGSFKSSIDVLEKF